MNTNGRESWSADFAVVGAAAGIVLCSVGSLLGVAYITSHLGFESQGRGIPLFVSLPTSGVLTLVSLVVRLPDFVRIRTLLIALGVVEIVLAAVVFAYVGSPLTDYMPSAYSWPGIQDFLRDPGLFVNRLYWEWFIGLSAFFILPWAVGIGLAEMAGKIAGAVKDSSQ